MTDREYVIYQRKTKKSDEYFRDKTTIIAKYNNEQEAINQLRKILDDTLIENNNHFEVNLSNGYTIYKRTSKYPEFTKELTLFEQNSETKEITRSVNFQAKDQT